MKFIKTADEGYINLSQVEVFYIEKYPKLYVQVKARMMNGDIYTLADYELEKKSTTKFDPKEAAQAWLDDFVAALNAEEYKNGKTNEAV